MTSSYVCACVHVCVCMCVCVCVGVQLCGGIAQVEEVVNGHGGWVEAKDRRTLLGQQRNGEQVRDKKNRTKCYLFLVGLSCLLHQRVKKGPDMFLLFLLQLLVQHVAHSMCFLNISCRKSAHSWALSRPFGVISNSFHRCRND